MANVYSTNDDKDFWPGHTMSTARNFQRFGREREKVYPASITTFTPVHDGILERRAMMEGATYSLFEWIGQYSKQPRGFSVESAGTAASLKASTTPPPPGAKLIRQHATWYFWRELDKDLSLSLENVLSEKAIERFVQSGAKISPLDVLIGHQDLFQIARTQIEEFFLRACEAGVPEEAISKDFDKLQKLLSLAERESSTENERRVALLRTRSLLERLKGLVSEVTK